MPSPNYFSSASLDRAGHLRRDPDWLREQLAHADTRLLLVRASEVVVDPDRRLAFLAGIADSLDHNDEGVVFLGLDDNGRAVFALDAADEARAPLTESLPDGHAFADVRGIASVLPAEEGHRVAYASAMMTWHRRHRWCGACGSLTTPDWAGHVRKCGGCGVEHYPRTDPVIIVVVTAGDNCLLGRQKAWPARMYSALAGFVEPGESIEDAVAREVKEETGVTTLDVTYHSSQPWPFPLSLMLGFHASAGPEPVPVTVDETELEAARWFSREELTDGIADGAVMVPPPFSIARTIIDAWLEGTA